MLERFTERHPSWTPDDSGTIRHQTSQPGQGTRVGATGVGEVERSVTMATSEKSPRRALTGLLSAALALAVVTTAPAEGHPRPAGQIQVSAPASDEGSTFAKRLESEYVDPDRVYSTDVRWWLGSASHTDETLLEEIQALYDAGYRGVELAMQRDSQAPDDVYAYGSDMWSHKWNLMMNKLHDAGKIDKVLLNGHVKDLTDNKWSDVNFIVPGRFGAVKGANSLVVYDVAGNTSTYHFALS